MNRTFLRLFTLSLAFVCGFTTLQAQSPIAQLRPIAQSDRVSANPDFGPQTQLTGHIPNWVANGTATAQSVDLNADMRITIVLQRDPAVQAAFTQFLTDQQTPGNQLYHQWLTPQQVGTLFGPTADDLAAVSNWLTAQGLSIIDVEPNQVMINVHGTTSAVANAFRTSFAYFPLNGEAHISAVNEPSVPSAIAPVISVIFGLTDLPLNPTYYRTGPNQLPAPDSSGATPKPMYTYTNGSVYYQSPGDFAIIYDSATVLSGGNKGAGSKARVAVIGRSRVAATDISEFATNTNIGSAWTLNTITGIGTLVDPGSVCTYVQAETNGCSTSGDQGEQTLDVDRVIGNAPGATVDLIVSANSGGGIQTAAQYNVSTQMDPIMTISYVGCEAQSGGQSADTTFDTIYSTGAAEGITTFVSSGDAGVNGCAVGNAANTTSYTASINYLCASSYATCVGGTEFADASSYSTYWNATNTTGLISAKTYIPEGAWNEPGTSSPFLTSASGGGPSLYISKPTNQTALTPADGKRDTPDIAYPAAIHDGYYACEDFSLGAYNGQGNPPVTSSSNCTTAGGGYFFVFGGTSAAAPAMAGVTALLNTKLGAAQGSINTMLYTLAASNSTNNVFHSINVSTSGVTGCSITVPSMCNNSTPGSSSNSTSATGGQQGYAIATSGYAYNETTGLGSIDVGNFLTAASSKVSTTLAIAATTNPINAGQSDTFTATLTRSSTTPGAATGTVQFYNNGVAFGSAVTISNNVAVSAAQTFSSTGTFSITAVYSGDTNYATSTTTTAVSLVVNAVLAITNGAVLTSGVVGTAYSQSLTATGGSGTGYSWTVTLGGSSLTAVGLNVSATGVVSGSSLTAGTANFGVKVTDSLGNTATTNFSVTIYAAVAITNGAVLPSGVVGTAYSQSLTATGGSGTGYSWTVTSGGTTLTALGLSLSSGGVVSGSSPTAGTANFGVKVTDSLGNTATTNFALTVNSGPSFTVVPATTTYNLISGVTTGNTDVITLTSTNSFVGSVVMTCSATTASGTAAGSCVATSPVSLSSGGTGTSTVTITTTPGTSGVLSVTVTGTSGATVVTSSAITVNLTASSFTLTPLPTTLNLAAGATTGNTSVVTVASVNGFAGSVTIGCSTAVVSGTPSGTCAASPTPVTLTAGGTTTTTVTLTSVAGSGGVLTENITGSGAPTGGTIAATATAAVTATLVVPTFTVVPATTTYNLISGATTANTDVFTLSSVNTFAGAVALTCSVANVSGTAAGACTILPTPVTLTSGGTGTSTLTIASTPGTSGVLNVTVKGTNGTTSVTSSAVTVNLTASSYTMSASPGTISIAGNATTGNTSTVTLTSVNGFAGLVTVTCASSNTAVATCTGGAATLTSGGTATVTVTAIPIIHTSGAGITLTASGSGTTTGATIAATASTTVGLTVTVVNSTTTVVAAPTTVVAGSPTTLTATVSGVSANGNPTGTVTFSAGGTVVGTGTLSGSGTATYTYTPSATSASATAVQITASYAGDSGYAASASTSGTTPLTISGATGAAASSSLSFTSGATTGNTDVVTFTSVGGYAGAVTAACTITASSGSPAFPATCTASAPANVTAGGTTTSTITITSTTAMGKMSGPQQAGLTGWGIRGGAVLAMLICLVPFRRRRIFRSLAAFALLACGLVAISGCSSSSPAAKQSSAGTYTLTATGTSGTSKANVTVTVTIN